MEEKIIDISKEAARAIIPYIIDKGVKLASKFFHDRFKKRISSLSGFEDGDTIIVLSSLYPTSMDKSIFKPVSIRDTENGKIEMRGTHVHSPVPLTGVCDSFGLARLAAELVKSEIDFELRVDPISAQEKECNLILFGSPSSNLVAREFYHNYLPPTAEFKYGPGYGPMIFQETTYGAQPLSGHLGLALKYRNPWNEDRQILWLAGIGPVGTEAAVFFVTQDFETDMVPEKIRKSRYWIAILEGEMTDDYEYVKGSRYRGGKTLR